MRPSRRAVQQPSQQSSVPSRGAAAPPPPHSVSLRDTTTALADADPAMAGQYCDEDDFPSSSAQLDAFEARLAHGNAAAAPPSRSGNAPHRREAPIVPRKGAPPMRPTIDSALPACLSAGAGAVVSEEEAERRAEKAEEVRLVASLNDCDYGSDSD